MQYYPQEPQQPQQPEFSRSLQFFIGIGIGLIPIILALFGLGPNSGGELFGIALILYGIEFVAMVVCLIIRRVRFIGYALLIMFCVAPFAVFIGCVVILSNRTM